MEATSKKVFISYSWAVQMRVIELAERLLANGVDVVLDVYDLKEGQDKYTFMEQSVNDPSIDRVLIICDKTYTEKANNRSGGVGDETVIISPEIYGNAQQEKFIPIVFEVDENGDAYRPAYLKSRIYFDLSSSNTQYEQEYEKLLRNIFEKPIHKKPALGSKPAWLDEEVIDLSSFRDAVKQIRGYTGTNPTKTDYLLHRALDEFVATAKRFSLPPDKPPDEGLLIAIDQTKSLRDLFVEFCEAVILGDLHVVDTMVELMERLYNELHDTNGHSVYYSSDFELADFIIWEVFITITAILLHFEKYHDIHTLLTRPYFLRLSFSSPTLTANSYFRFRTPLRTLETTCKAKSKDPRLFTLSGDILVHREKKPILTVESISNADLVLYQLGEILELPDCEWDYWFPVSYVYNSGTQPLWKKLQSSAHCQKIAPLFGVENISDLKAVVSHKPNNTGMRYGGAFRTASNIIDCIKISDIGTLK